MKHRTKFSHLFQGLLPILVCLVAVGGLLLGAQPAVAQQLSGPTVTGDICMQQIFGTPVSSSNRLNCTANDVRISGVALDENGEALVDPKQCIEGTTFDLTATFEIVVTANARYDTAFFFRIDGGSNARGDGVNADGLCSLSALTPGIPPALNLDGDTCGDLNAGTYQVTFTIPDVECTGVPNPDNPEQRILRLPNCTSWHSNQATACDITDPFDFQPDTKSKCVCDDNFTVPVIVAAPEGAVSKTATEALVTYAITVENTSTTTSVIVDALNDSLYGDITTTGHNGITETTCATGTELATSDGSPGGPDTTTCTFKVLYSNPGTIGNKSNTVTATLRSTLSGDDADFPSNEVTINVNLNVTTP